MLFMLVFGTAIVSGFDEGLFQGDGYSDRQYALTPSVVHIRWSGFLTSPYFDFLVRII